MGNAANKSGNGSTSTSQQHRYSSVDIETSTINRGTTQNPRPMLKFHTVCGGYIHLNSDKSTARRRPEFFCKGLAFSDRPVEINEVICLKIVETSAQWSGVLRFGLTNVDPASFRDIELPKFACPDLIQKTGSWAKSLSEKHCVQGSVLHFYVNRHGTVFYGRNGINKGIFISDIDVTKPLWTVVDIYGNTLAVEFLSVIDSATRTAVASLDDIFDDDVALVASAPAEDEPSASTAPLFPVVVPTTPSSRPVLPIGLENLPYFFHRKLGSNAVKVSNWEISRKESEFSNAYCFLNRPIRVDEVLAIKIEATELMFGGAIGFGLTSCNPDTINPLDLPVDADNLLERSEYWVVIKDVGVRPNLGDILQFQLKADGRVMFSKNDAFPRPIMYMDASIDLWPFFDLFGKTKSIRLIRPREGLFRRPASIDTDDDEILPALQPPTRPPPPRFTSLLSETERLGSNSSNEAMNDEVEDEILASYRRNRERLMNEANTNASNTINQVRENVPETRNRSSGRTTEDILQRTEDFLNSLNARLNIINLNEPRTSTNLTVPSTLGLQTHSETNLQTPTTPTSPYLQRSLRSSLTSVTSPPMTSRLKNENNRPNIPPRTKEATPPISSNQGARPTNTIDVECSICLFEKANSCIYRCGHVCMCMNCARELMTRSDFCPICRQPITDVVQVFFS